MRKIYLTIGIVAAAVALGASIKSKPPFAVVVHQSNATVNLRFSDLQDFFAGHSKKWPNGNKVVLVERSPESPAFRFLLGRVLNMSAVEHKRRLANIEFMGETPVTSRS